MRQVTKIELADARVLVDSAIGTAAAIGVPMCVAVVDDGGVLVAFGRMDFGKVTSVQLAIDKAYTAAGARQDTAFYGDSENPLSPTWRIHNTDRGRFVTLRGGVVLRLGEEVVGGVGVSGGTGPEDLTVAESALATWQSIVAQAH